jgi:large subunit ribosomal protein L13e
MHHIKPKIIKERRKQRNGRGFSREELKKAGLSSQEAARIELPADQRRKTAHDENVETIKAFVAKQKAEAKPKQEPKLEPKKKAKS